MTTGEPNQAPPLLSVADLASIYCRAIAIAIACHDDDQTTEGR